MLALAPKPCEPVREIANSLKMFQPEMRKQGVKFDYCIDQSYYDIAIDWVMADLARIAQVLINLVSSFNEYIDCGSVGLSTLIFIGLQPLLAGTLVDPPS